MLQTHTERPRELRWYHAGPMLYGDWGTSRFYVLGIALALSFHASFYYVLAVGLLVAAVGWAYTIICRCYPDGGGVYSAAKHSSRQLAVVGALLLFADYIVTAAMSAYDGIRYMGIHAEYAAYVAMGAIFIVGIINYIGPRRAGAVALVITLATLLLTFILVIFAIPHIPLGWSAIQKPAGPVTIQWSHFVGVVLALSGVEAIANMTGIMVPPVTKTSKKAIWPVLIEVVILNLVLAVAMNALPKAGYDLGDAPKQTYANVEDIQEKFPDWQTNPEALRLIQTEAANAGVDPAVITHRSPELQERQKQAEDAVLRVMATVYVHPWFGIICGIVFGALLISAVNTAVADMISIQYVMSRDTELPHILTKLNLFGVPWYALIAAVGLPVIVLNIFQDLNTLSGLYAVGVVGAIAINLGSCCTNKQMPVKSWERAALGLLALVMVVIELTLLWEKPDARYFAIFIVGTGLAARFFTKTYPLLNSVQRAIALFTWTGILIVAAGVIAHFQPAIAVGLHAKVALFQRYESSAGPAVYFFGGLLLMAAGASAIYGINYLLGKVPHVVPAPAGVPLAPAPAVAGAGSLASEQIDMSKPRVLVATRGGRRMLEFAANYCRKTNAVLFVLFVRQVNVNPAGTLRALAVHEDPDAVAAFAMAREICQTQGVQMFPIYAVSPDVPYTILDFAVTYGVEALLMGVSRAGALLRALRGDVLTAVADNLPTDIPLLICA